MSHFSEVELSESAGETIRMHGEKEYPEEACGFLVGPQPGPDEAVRHVDIADPADNEKSEERTHRFLLSPVQVRRAESFWDERGKTLIGIYHSHPDHTAEPSLFDLEHGWPWYAYLLVSVRAGKAGPPAAFELDADRKGWVSRPVRVVPSPDQVEDKKHDR